MSAHTSPAPWRIGQPAPDIQARATVRDAHGWDVAHCFGEDTAEANAALIAAAPDMAEALTLCVEVLDHHAPSIEWMRAAINKARAALAKAQVQP